MPYGSSKKISQSEAEQYDRHAKTMERLNSDTIEAGVGMMIGEPLWGLSEDHEEDEQEFEAKRSVPTVVVMKRVGDEVMHEGAERIDSNFPFSAERIHDSMVDNVADVYEDHLGLTNRSYEDGKLVTRPAAAKVAGPKFADTFGSSGVGVETSPGSRYRDSLKKAVAGDITGAVDGLPNAAEIRRAMVKSEIVKGLVKDPLGFAKSVISRVDVPSVASEAGVAGMAFAAPVRAMYEMGQSEDPIQQVRTLSFKLIKEPIPSGMLTDSFKAELAKDVDGLYSLIDDGALTKAAAQEVFSLVDSKEFDKDLPPGTRVAVVEPGDDDEFIASGF